MTVCIAALCGEAWDTKEPKWEEAFARVEAFAERNGHARVPTTYSEDRLSLGR